MKNTELQKKIETLSIRLTEMKKVLVAFSGGKDSFFLLEHAIATLGKENAIACNVRSSFSSQNDLKRVRYFREKLDFNMESLTIDLSGEKAIMANPKDRCYFCKTKIFSQIKEKARELGISWIIDGTTCSDLNEYRPGLKALEELEIISPLRDSGITSAEIISYLREEKGIDEYYLTSSACMATRFPYNFNLDENCLKVFDNIEHFLVENNIFPVKVRYIPDGIRIETPGSLFLKIIEQRESIIKYSSANGIKFVTLDLGGIKTGVWD